MRAHRSGSILSLALGLCLLLAGCGEQAPTQNPEEVGTLVDRLQRAWNAEDPAERAKLLRDLGRRGKQKPTVVMPVLIERLRTERENPGTHTLVVTLDYSESGLTRDEQKAAARAASEVLRKRAQSQVRPDQLRFDIRSVDKEGIARISVTLFDTRSEDPEKDAGLRMLRDALGRPGSAEIAPMIDRPAEGQSPSSLWSGDADSYDKYVATHLPALQAGVAEGRRLSAGEGETRLVLVRPLKAGEKRGTALVLRSSSRTERFLQEDFSLSGSLVAETGDLVLKVALDKASQARFDAWCVTHKGRTAALLVDEEVVLTFPVPNSAKQVEYMVVGNRSNLDEGGRLGYILRAVLPGAISARMSLDVQDEKPQHMHTAIAMAIVNVGRKADSYLEPVQAEGGLLGRRARWIRDKIRQEEREASEPR